MSEIIEPVTVEGDFIYVPLIVWLRFRSLMPGLVERIHDMNRGLAGLGAFLPVGATFNLPVPAPRKPAILDTIRLW